MGHNLNYHEISGQYAYAGIKPAWYKLGQIVEGTMTAEEAIKLAHLDYDVIKEPIYHLVGNEATPLPIPGFYCTKRTDTEHVFGVVKSKYTILQNNEAFGFFDTIVGEGKAIYESVGALGKGEVIFIVAKLPSRYYIKGDESVIDQYLVLTNGHDGTKQLAVYFTPVSVCCQNTLNASLRNNSHKLTVRHTASVVNNVKIAGRIMGISDKIIEKDQEMLTWLASEQLSSQKRSDIIEKLFIVSDKPDEVTSARTKNLINSFLAYSDMPVSDSYRSLRGTKYAFYQDVTGWLQHIKNKGNGEKNMKMIMQDSSAFKFSQKALTLLDS